MDVGHVLTALIYSKPGPKLEWLQRSQYQLTAAICPRVCGRTGMQCRVLVIILAKREEIRFGACQNVVIERVHLPYK